MTEGETKAAGTMRAIVQREFGDPSVLVVEEVEVPRPAPGQARVRVEAAGVHLLDTRLRAGADFGGRPLPELPMTPGREIAGTVDAVGDGADESLLGRRVVGHQGLLGSGYAEYAVISAGALFDVGEGIPLPSAIAQIGTGRTAQQILELADIEPGDVVAVPGAAGGLGSQLLQLARARGATAIALVSSERKAEAVAGRADRVILAEAGGAIPREAFDGAEPSVLLDGVGGRPAKAAFDRLVPGGRAVLFGWASGEVLSFDHRELVTRGLRVTGALGLPSTAAGQREFQRRALAALAEGVVDPIVELFPLERAAEAHAAIESRSSIGKVVITP